MTDDYKIETNCPKCDSSNIDRDSVSDYTGGGYADYYDEYQCFNCEYEWKIYFKNDYS